MRTVKTLFILIFCCFMIILSAPNSGAADAEMTDTYLLLECNILEDGVVEISLIVDSSSGLCGLLATLEYDGSELLLVSCGVGEQNENALNFTYRAENGRVIFLLDGNQNSTPRGVLASFYFKRTDENAQLGQIRLLPVADRCAFRLDGKGGFQEIMPDATKASISPDSKAPDDQVPADSYNRLCAVSSTRFGGELLLYITGRTSGQKCFAAGFKVFAVDTQTAKTSMSIVAKVISGNEAELPVHVPFDERTCVIITPLSYNGKCIVEGEKQLFLFE